jgi:hypothetical protein
VSQIRTLLLVGRADMHSDEVESVQRVLTSNLGVVRILVLKIPSPI